ncbi:MAG: sulfotransferase [Gammaproteobacteria bacterium]|nr:sulfotransferase [Gammaproteobacteria bacterium]
MAERKIIYIGGWGRSGSSLLANLLGSHADAMSVGELRYIWDRGVIDDKRCGCGEEFSQCDFWTQCFAGGEVRVDEAQALHLTRNVGSRATWRQILASLTGGIGRYQRRHAAELDLLRRLYRAAANTATTDVLIDSSKTPPYAINLLGDPDVEFYFLHLVRDPRAVAYSWSRKLASKEARDHFLPRYSGVKCAIYWCAFNLFGLMMRARPNTNYLQIRYEDFTATPRDTLASVFTHCGMRVDGLTWINANTAEVAAQHSISGNPSRFDTGTVSIRCDDEWHTQMPAGKRWLVTLLCAPLLRLFGYRLDHSKPLVFAPTADSVDR